MIYVLNCCRCFERKASPQLIYSVASAATEQDCNMKLRAYAVKTVMGDDPNSV